jgi:hypothetical protein
MNKTFRTAALIATLVAPAASFAFNNNEYGTPAFQPTTADIAAGRAADAQMHPTQNDIYALPAFVAKPEVLVVNPLAEQIRQQIAQSRDDRWGRVTVLADADGEIVLRGLVATPSQAARIQQLARNTAGVTAVVNDLQVQDEN